jgi:hypothetical protein
MRLDELFQASHHGSQQPIKTRLQQIAIDFLTPLVAHKVPFITVQQMIDELRKNRPGILVDRGFVMDLLDPQTVKAVKSIEGDRINLQEPSSVEHKVDDNEAQKEVDKIKDMAKQKAQKDVKKS